MKRFIFALGLILAFASLYETVTAISCGRGQHNAFFGWRRPGDTMLSMGHPMVKGGWMRVTEQMVSYPSVYDRKGNITYIEIYDQYRNGSGACPFLVQGGVGTKYVSLHFVSQRGQGIDFIYRIYGNLTRF